MLINRENLNLLFTGFNTQFRTGLIPPATTDRAPFVFDATSSGKSSVYPWVSQLPRVRQWLGARQAHRLGGNILEIQNLPFESTVRVLRDDIEDDQFGSYGPLFLGLGREGMRWKDEFCFGLLSTAFTTVTWDGQYACDTDHPVLDANGNPSQVSNSAGGGGNPWFFVDASKKPFSPLIFQTRRDFALVRKDREEDDNVFDNREFVYGMDGRFNAAWAFWQLIYGSKQDLGSDDNFNAAYAAHMAMVTDYNKPLGVKPTHLVCGPSNRAKALARVARTLANGAENPNAGLVQVVVTNYLP
jgi:phage major head subunit gpT-like protein